MEKNEENKERKHLTYAGDLAPTYIVKDENILGLLVSPLKKGKPVRINVMAVDYLSGGDPMLLDHQVTAHNYRLARKSDEDKFKIHLFYDDKIYITFPAVFKKSQGKGAGLYAVTAMINDKRQTRVLSKEDVQKYFSLDKEGKQNFAFELADKYLVKDPGKERIAEAKENFEKAMDEHLEQESAQLLEVTLARHDVSLGNLFRDAEGKYYTDSGIEQDMSKPVHLYRLSPATDPYGEPDVLVDNIKVLNPPSYRETRMQQHSFDYMMLDRLRGDIEAYLNKPGDCRFQNKSQIWGQDTEVLVKEMRKLWDKIPADIKPEWLTEEKLKDYETAVTNEKNVSNFLEKVGEASDGKEYNMYEDEVDEEEDEEISRGFHR